MVSVHPKKSPPKPRRSPSPWWLLPGIYLVLVGGTFVTFSGVMGHDFINFDDDKMIYDNPRVNKGLTLDGLRFALTGPHVGNWHPLTTLSHIVDCQIFGSQRPGMHHLVSLGLHIGAVLLLFEALRRMTGDVWPSALVAALFAIHPMRVESVAWASERKDVLSGFFWMLTLLAYVWYARRPDLRRYLVVMFLFCLGLMSKPMVVTLPCVLLLLDWWPLGRWRPGWFTAWQNEHGPQFPEQTAYRLILEKLPLLAVAAVVAVVTAYVQRNLGATPSLAELPLSWRLIGSVTAYVSYLGKTIWPTGLAVLYPHPGLALSAEIRPWIVPALGATLLLVAVTACFLYYAPRRPYLMVGWLYFLGTLVPVIGLVQVGQQAFADRYSYLSMIGVYVAFAWFCSDLVRRWPAAKHPLTILATAWLLCLMAVAWHQVNYWRDSQTLFKHTLQVTGDNPTIQYNLGVALQGMGRNAEAIAHYQEALRFRPNYALAHINLANALAAQGRIEEAAKHYQEALRINPNFAEAHNNWGNALAGVRRIDEAVVHYEEALHIDPNFADAHINWGNALAGVRRIDEAVVHYGAALRIDPNFAEAHLNWGNALAGAGHFVEAVPHYEEALRIYPHYAETHLNWGNALARMGRYSEAISHYREALKINPRYAEAHLYWGSALAASGNTQEAMDHYKTALQFKPNYAEVHFNWGNALGGQKRFREAVQHYQEALRMNPRFAEAHLNWGNVLAIQGQFQNAAKHFQEALRLNPNLAAARDNLRAAEVLQREKGSSP